MTAPTPWKNRRLENKKLSPKRATGAQLSSQDAAKTDVTRRSIDRFALARGGPVAQAVVGRAQMRASFHHPASDRAAGFVRRATGCLGGCVARRREETRGPFPDVADHVVEPIAVGGK